MTFVLIILAPLMLALSIVMFNLGWVILAIIHYRFQHGRTWGFTIALGIAAFILAFWINTAISDNIFMIELDTISKVAVTSAIRVLQFALPYGICLYKLRKIKKTKV